MKKILSILWLAMTLLPLEAQRSTVDSPSPVTLDSLRDHYRPVLIFAPTHNRTFIAQMRLLTQGDTQLHERDVIVIPVLLRDGDQAPASVINGRMSAEAQAAARLRFHIRPNDFTVILIGKDGGEKLRLHRPLSLDTLCSTIDAMPMRQEEQKARSRP